MFYTDTKEAEISPIEFRRDHHVDQTSIFSFNFEKKGKKKRKFMKIKVKKSVVLDCNLSQKNTFVS